MREHKYRAWDDVEKKLYSPKEIFNDFDGAIWQSLDGDGKLVYDKILDSYGNRRELTLMQYTGKKDKTGEDEIYEGDIILGETEWNLGVGLIKGYVEWNNNRCLYVVRGIINGDAELVRAFSIVEVGDIEVIGNIYENPELLKTKG